MASGDEARHRLARRLARRAVHTRNQAVVYVSGKVYTLFSPFEVNRSRIERIIDPVSPSRGTVAACRRERLGARGVRASCCALATVSNSSLQPGACYCVPTEALCSIGPCVVLVCTVWYTAVCSSAVFVLFRMNSGPCAGNCGE